MEINYSGIDLPDLDSIEVITGDTGVTNEEEVKTLPLEGKIASPDLNSTVAPLEGKIASPDLNSTVAPDIPDMTTGVPDLLAGLPDLKLNFPVQMSPIPIDDDPYRVFNPAWTNQKFFEETTPDSYPQHLIQAELGTRQKYIDKLATRLHGSGLNTIGYGLDLQYDPNNYKYLKTVGVSDSTILKLKKGDSTARITLDQAKRASDMAYKAKYKQISKRLKRGGIDLEGMSKWLKAVTVSLGYNGYLSSARHTKNKRKKRLYQFRSTIWDFIKAGNEKGLADYIKNSKYRGGTVKKRLVRAGLL